MQTLKKVLRAIGLVLSTWLLWLTLGSGLTLLASTTHLTNRETVKNWPVRADAYENIVDMLPAVIAEEGGVDDGKSLQQQLDDSGLDQDKLLAAIDDAIPPEYLESQANIALDALYDVLEGKEDALAFTLPISEKSKELTDTLANELLTQISEYPACTPKELTELASGEFDPLAAKCIPPGVDVKNEIQFTSQDLGGGEDSVVNDIEVTAGDVSFINKNVGRLQEAFAAAQSLPTMLIISTLLLGTLVILFSKTLLHGIRKLGGILFLQGIGTAIFYFLLPRLSTVAADTISAENEGRDVDAEQSIIDNFIEPLLSVVLGDISSTGLRISLLTAAIGTVLWLGVYTWHKVHHHPQDAHAPKKPEVEVGQQLETPETETTKDT